MSYFHYGILFLIGVIVVAAIKSEYNTRIFLVIVLIGLIAFAAKMKKRR